MDNEWLGGLESLRKRRVADEDTEIELMIRNLWKDDARNKRLITTEDNRVCMWQLIDGGAEAGRRQAENQKPQIRSNKNKSRGKEGLSHKEADSNGSTASNSSVDGNVTTSHSFKNRGFSQKWKEKDTRLFYKALSLFGTDFSMVALLFRGRDRSQLINKYHKEERDDSARVENALRQHRQGSSKVLRHCNNLLNAPEDEIMQRCRGGSGSSLDSLDLMITAELGSQINRARQESSPQIPGSSGQP